MMDKFLIVSAAVMQKLGASKAGPIMLKCRNCQCDTWNVFYDPIIQKLVLGCTKCERPVSTEIDVVQ